MPVSRIWNSGVPSASVLAWTMVLPPEVMKSTCPAPVSGASPSQTKAWLPATAVLASMPVRSILS